jgi:D-3-phosphoglycerate dehydrogenase
VTRSVVLVTAADLAEEAMALLQDYDVVFLGKTPSEEDVFHAVTRHQPVGIIVRYSAVSRRSMEASRNLRVVSKHGAGTDTIDKQAAAELGIEVRAAIGANADAVAEHSWALILAAAKGIVRLDRRMHEGRWDKATHKSFELKGKTLGVVGLGAIGRRVALIGVAFGMEVLAFDPFAKEATAGVQLVALEELLRQSHVVSLNCPLTGENRHMINRTSIATMRDGAILVNTGRGGLVDDAALIEGLASGKLRAAGLDSFVPEPLVGEHPYRAVDNAILSPHIGGVSEDAYVNMGVAAARNVLAVLRSGQSSKEEVQ